MDGGLADEVKRDHSNINIAKILTDVTQCASDIANLIKEYCKTALRFS